MVALYSWALSTTGTCSFWFVSLFLFCWCFHRRLCGLYFNCFWHHLRSLFFGIIWLRFFVSIGFFGINLNRSFAFLYNYNRVVCFCFLYFHGRWLLNLGYLWCLHLWQCCCSWLNLEGRPQKSF